jgi:hypothetical protein
VLKKKKERKKREESGDSDTRVLESLGKAAEKEQVEHRGTFRWHLSPTMAQCWTVINEKA